jgi:hypothetical protein
MNFTLGAVAHLLKWLYYALFFSIVGYFVWKYRDRVLAALRDFWDSLCDFWSRLLGRRDVPQVEQARPESAEAVRLFSDFADPFASGASQRWSPREIVTYTFEALEAWGRQHGQGRGVEQTPHEFARQLAQHDSAVGSEARKLADLYCHAAFSQAQLAPDEVAGLSRLWQTLRSEPEAA